MVPLWDMILSRQDRTGLDWTAEQRCSRVVVNVPLVQRRLLIYLALTSGGIALMHL
jgi:hypothetical protein